MADPMQTETFIARVAESSAVADDTVAAGLVNATVETLCMHLPAEQSRRLTAQLPRELTQSAQKGVDQRTGPTEHVTLDTFYSQIATRANMRAEDVKTPVQAVIDTLGEAVTDGEFSDVVFDLPPEINGLFAG